MQMTTATSSTGGENMRHLQISSNKRPEETKPQPRMVRLTVNLPSTLVEQMRDAVYWTPGLTLAWMIARAVRVSLNELESIHQGPFPRRAKPLRAGRPRLLGQSLKVQPQPPSHGFNGSSDGALQSQAVPRESKE